MKITSKDLEILRGMAIREFTDMPVGARLTLETKVLDASGQMSLAWLKAAMTFLHSHNIEYLTTIELDFPDSEPDNEY